MSKKLWGGRFEGDPDAQAWALNASLAFDQRLAAQDVRGSQAWAAALLAAGVLDAEEAAAIQSGLSAIADEFAAGGVVFAPGDEDIHTAVERRLAELIGPAAGKLHTGRSRNDQVATDLRLWLLDELPALQSAVAALQAALLARAQQDQAILLPGYTHLQRAQPILLGHWWLAHFWPLQRDQQRLAQLAERAAVSPLGAGALAGVPFPVDRTALAATLGFSAAAANSLDAVSDRDFVAEFLFAAALLGVHLSKLAEAVVLFSTTEFGFFELADAYASGSSLMPQKKNPDVFELARGKTGRLIGNLVEVLTLLKGLPSTYDKDLQGDKEPLFESYDTLIAVLPVLAGGIAGITPQAERMRAAIDDSLMATDLADYLVARGVPFREAHEAAGKAARAALQAGVPLSALPLADYQTIHAAFAEDLYAVFDPQASVARRAALGGTAPAALAEQIRAAHAALAPHQRSQP